MSFTRSSGYSNPAAFRVTQPGVKGSMYTSGAPGPPPGPPPAVTGFVASNPWYTSIDLNWDISSGATLYSIDTSPPTAAVTTSGTSITYPYLSPGLEYTLTITPSNAYGDGPPTNVGPVYTLFNAAYLTYTGTIETMFLPTGSYNFEIGGGSGPYYSTYGVAAFGSRSFGSFGYTVTSPITIQYAIGQASPGNIGGAGGTFVYDVTNSQMLFVAGGGGSQASSIPYDMVNGVPIYPGDGSGGAAGSGGGSGAGVNSNGSNSTANAGSGGLTFGNGATGGAGGGISGTTVAGGFGGGGGGTVQYDFDLPPAYIVPYSGGGGGYTGGTTYTVYNPGFSLYSTSNPGTSYMISSATFNSWNNDAGMSVNGYLNIIPV